MTKDLMIGLGSTFLGNSIFIKKTDIFINADFGLTAFMKFLPVLFSLSGGLLSLLLYSLFIHKSFLSFVLSKFR